MANAVIYARYSSHSQREESIEDQVRVCREVAAREGDVVVEVYADKAISGTSTDGRAAFARMVEDSAQGAWTKVYVYKTDRFARNRYDSATYKARLKRNGVRVVSATENIQEGPDGILLEALLEGMAEYYSANLGENVRRGMRGNALKCMHNGVTVFGYDHAPDGRFEVNEEEARAVRKAFGMYAAGAGMPEVAEALSAYRTRRGSPIRMQTLTGMLRNEKYAGVYSFKDVRVEGGMPAIVDRETFDRVQERLAGRVRRRRGVVDYVLTGRLFDADGNRYHGRSGHGASGEKYAYYRCEETRHQVRKDRMEAAVAEAARRLVESGDADEAIADLVMAEQDEALLDDLALMDSLRSRIAANGRERERVVDLAAKVGATDELAAKLLALKDEESCLRAELAEMERGTPVLEREQVAFWVREVTRAGDPAEVARLFARRVVIDRERGEMSLEFTFDEGAGSSREVKLGFSDEAEENASSEAVSECSHKSNLAGVPGFEPR